MQSLRVSQSVQVSHDTSGKVDASDSMADHDHDCNQDQVHQDHDQEWLTDNDSIDLKAPVHQEGTSWAHDSDKTWAERVAA